MLLPAAVLFHLSIAVTMGLWSFAFAMWAGLLLLLAPLGHDPDIKQLFRRATPETAETTAPAPQEPGKERVPA
jgi:hypothetical protein